MAKDTQLERAGGIEEVVGCLPFSTPLKNMWGTFPTCQIPEENRHVGNVPHFFNRLLARKERFSLSGLESTRKSPCFSPGQT